MTGATTTGIIFERDNPSGDVCNCYVDERVKFVGDVNGDGFGDVLFGASGGANNRVYLMFGKSTAWPSPYNLANLGTNGVLIRSETVYDDNYNGRSLAALGDVNNDGYADFAIGAPNRWGTDYDVFRDGQVFIIYGRASWPASLDLDTLSGSSGVTLSGFGLEDGWAASLGAGDFNGDGHVDLIVGAIRSGDTSIVFGPLRFCPGISAPSQGSLVASTCLTPASSCTTTCNDGYILTAGDAQRTCQADFTYTGSPAVCSPNPTECTVFAAPADGAFVTSSCAATGSSCTTSCNDGYVLGSGAASRTCLAGGNFSGSPAVCSPNSTDPSNVKVSGASLLHASSSSVAASVLACLVSFSYI